MKNLRTHGKSTIVWLLMGLLVLGLGGFGVTNFVGGGSAIGAVGETEITAEEYARRLQAEMNAYTQQTGQQFTMAQAQAIGLPQAVQARLFTTAALGEEARRIGLSVGDEQVARTISEAPNFKNPSGSFDRVAYQEFIRRQNLTEAEFENDIREDEARLILQRAVVGGVVAPGPMVDQTAKWMLETRDFTWRELTADELPQSVDDPDQAALEAWHQANADRFTAPETRKITYVWLTPEMLADEVELDETALRDLYGSRSAEFQQPERRMVSRLVFPDAAAAEAAKARLDAGEVPFETLVIERGLALEDVDLGELSQEQLGVAGDAVFALEGPGVVGPIQTNLGPALFSMHAILEPVNVSFEEARADLRAEAAADRARRIIESSSAEYEDMLASGASLEDMDKDTPMQLGQIDWTVSSQPEHGSISNYQSFREHAASVTQADFAELFALDDGGVFALRLDEIVAPTLRPFDEIRDEVLADWRESETHRQLLELAEDEKLAAVAASGPENAVPVADAETEEDQGAPAAQSAATPAVGLTRDGWIDGVPPDVVSGAFAIAEAGDADVVDAQGRVFLVTLDAIHDADLASDEAQAIAARAGQVLGQSLQSDVFDYFTRAVQMRDGVRVNDSVINGVNAQVQ